MSQLELLDAPVKQPRTRSKALNIATTSHTITGDKQMAQSLKELLALQKEIQEKIQLARLHETVNTFKQIDMLLQDAGMTPDDLLKHYKPVAGVKKKRESPKPKYGIPSGETWSGRGKMGIPIKRYLESHPDKTLADLLIDKSF